MNIIVKCSLKISVWLVGGKMVTWLHGKIFGTTLAGLELGNLIVS